MRGDVANVNSNTNSNPYVALGSNTAYDAAGFMQFTNPGGSFVGTGMLVATSTPGQYKFLTAAHNVDSGADGKSPDGVPDASAYDIYFGPRTSGDGSTATGHVSAPAASVSIMPRWVAGGGGLTKASSQYDLAVITFNLGMVVSGAIPANPFGFSLTSAAGKTGTMVGFGSFGLGSGFAGNPSDGVRRAGNNTIDVAGTAADNPANTGSTLQTDFDSPTDASKSTLGSPIPLTLEASTAGGDSGGPLLVNENGTFKIVGVLNGGFPGAGGNLSEYGDRSIWASISQTENLAYLMGQDIAVPEPSTYAALALGAVALGGCLRRRARASAC